MNGTSTPRGTATATAYLPTEPELVLLCLDYLRRLRRDGDSTTQSDYLTIACWALNRSFTDPALQQNNDAHFSAAQKRRHPNMRTHGLPSLVSMEQELLYRPDKDSDQKKQDDDEDDEDNPYAYDDSHASNALRFYPLEGLASGPVLQGALTLGQVTAAGLAGLNARSRLAAEKELVQSPLFEQFLQAVQAKGFFEEGSNADPAGNYEERYRKVVAKFRTKLASKQAEQAPMGDLVAHSAAEQQRQASSPATPTTPDMRKNVLARLMMNPKNGDDKDSVSVVSSSVAQNPLDLEEAEKLKSTGNSCMQNKEYQKAADCYTVALKLSPDGPNSHVYFSNRAAALVSMKQFHEAILDSERSLALRPDYGKAHARLGLAHFLLGNYRHAMEAYTVALKYEPENTSSKNYLEKSAQRLAELGEKGNSSTQQHASFSVVSEWEKNSHQKQNSVDSAVREAEKYKVKGNCSMANREYQAALDAYCKAIQLCPKGANSHVYYSNRAAALCYLERYTEAEEDSMRSLDLNPNYGKAHARLGLSRFFLQDYAGAVDAYTAALKHDPDNTASKSYLAKARAKLESTQRRTSRHVPVRR